MRHACVECGMEIGALGLAGSGRLCLECARWMDVLDRILEPGNIRIGGIQYWIRELPPASGIPTHTIMTHDGGLFTTTDLVRMGRVPDHFTSRLADNAVFVDVLEDEA
jgi:hypothetical protein